MLFRKVISILLNVNFWH